MPEDDIKSKSRDLVLKYHQDLQEDLVYELLNLKQFYTSNFGRKQLNTLQLLNHLYT